jgi:hypothetical protein
VLVQFEAVLASPNGTLYVPRASGRELADGRWEGWIEFVPSTDESGSVLSSPRETIQPNRGDLAYWASGLTLVYLEGAFQRAWDATGAVPRVTAAMPPATRPSPPLRPPVDVAVELAPHAVLNPFDVYAQGEDVLRQQLRALDVSHLQEIARAYNFATPSIEGRSELRTELEMAILTGVKSRTENS